MPLPSYLGGEQIIVSNMDLTDSRVRNYKRMAKRRVVFRLGVTYQTPAALLREIPGIVADIFREIEGAALDKVHFFSYGDFTTRSWMFRSPNFWKCTGSRMSPAANVPTMVFFRAAFMWPHDSGIFSLHWASHLCGMKIVCIQIKWHSTLKRHVSSPKGTSKG